MAGSFNKYLLLHDSVAHQIIFGLPYLEGLFFFDGFADVID
jgi:hypothetical protein